MNNLKKLFYRFAFKKFIAKKRYYVTKTNEITITPMSEFDSFECIGGNSKIQNQNDLKNVIVELFNESIVSELEEQRCYYGFTHGFFVKLFSENPQIQIIGRPIPMGKRQVAALKEIWKCPQCACCENPCYIPEYVASKACTTEKQGYFVVFQRVKD